MEVEAEVQLSDHRRRDADRWRALYSCDTGGNFYALDARSGQTLWGRKSGAIGGGVPTYLDGERHSKKVAVATGYVSPAMPVEIRRAKIAILGRRKRREPPMTNSCLKQTETGVRPPHSALGSANRWAEGQDLTYNGDDPPFAV